MKIISVTKNDEGQSVYSIKCEHCGHIEEKIDHDGDDKKMVHQTVPECRCLKCGDKCHMET